MKQIAYKILIVIKMFLVRHVAYRRLMAQTRQCRETQERVLREILDAAKDTEFGIDHGFASVVGYAGFCAKVPVCDYEYLRPYINRQIHHGTTSLNMATPVPKDSMRSSYDWSTMDNNQIKFSKDEAFKRLVFDK